MPIYKCDNCNKQFRQKIDFERHKNRKNPCKFENHEESEKIINESSDKDIMCAKINKIESSTKLITENNNECKYCHKIFSTNSNYNRHMKQNCKKRRAVDGEKENIFRQLLEENRQIQLKNKELEENNKKLENEIHNIRKKVNARLRYMKNVTTNSNNNIIKDNNITNNTNNTNNTIMLVGYGKEDIMKLDKQQIVRAVSAGFYSTNKLTDLVHFDPKHPEYHNVYIGSMKDKYAMMYDGTNWTLVTKIGLINKIYDSKKAFIEENFEEFRKLLTPHQIQSLERWLDVDDEDPKITEIKESIKLLLYNKRTIPLQTRDVGLLAVTDGE